MSELLTERSGRIVAARKLTRRSGRDDAGLFLAEGRQAVAEALADLAVTDAAAFAALVEVARAALPTDGTGGPAAAGQGTAA